VSVLEEKLKALFLDDTKAGLVAWTAFLLVAGALVAVFLYVPTDDFQGPTQKILYFHAPAAWNAMLCMMALLVYGILFLWLREPVWDTLALAAGEVGFLFCSLNLATGMLWGKPIWGTYWTWDSRLTSALVLWFIYLSYLLLRNLTENPEARARAGAILGILGCIDLPVIHFSVLWWRTLHPQPAAISPAGLGAGLESGAMKVTLLLGFVALTMAAIALYFARVRQEFLRQELHALQARLVS
jgi:heme exporter protein C